MKTFNVIQYLEDSNIEYHTAGEKNVSKGWIEITCPFCNDPSWHCGVHLKHSNFNCYHCREKGNMTKLLKALSNITYKKVKEIIKKYSNIIKDDEDEEIISEVKEVFLPKTEKVFPNLHLNYLIKRGFDPKVLIPKYSLKACYTYGNYSYRIVIPYLYHKKLVTFTTRDVTDTSDLRYKNLSSELSILKTTNTLYNIDTVKDKVIICEGITDVWRMGDESVALSTNRISNNQVKQLFQKKISKALILLDSNTEVLADEVAGKIGLFIPEVKIIMLENGDPAELKQSEVKEIRRIIWNSG